MFTLNFYKFATMQQSAEQQPTYYRTYNGEEATNSKSNSLARWGLMLNSLFAPIANTASCASINSGISTEQELIESYTYRGMASGQMVDNRDMRNAQPLVMLLGDGTTAPTKEDYKMESFIGSDKLLCTNKTYDRNMTYTADSDTALTHSWTFQNITNEPVTVKEVGLAFKTCESNSYDHHYDEYNFTVLIAREVLASPVTIAPNAKYTFDFAFTF